MDIRERNSEFSVTSGYNKKTLLTKLSETVLTAKEVIKGASEGQLTKKREVQGYSFSGIDFAVMALPTEKDTYLLFWLYRILRMITLKSKSPSGAKYPTAPLYTPRLKDSSSSIIFCQI